MRLGTIAFFVGILVFHSLPELPNRWWGLMSLVTAFAILWVPKAHLLAWGATGFLWALLWTPASLQLQLPPEFESVDLRVEGWVASIPETVYQSIRFELDVTTLQVKEQEVLPFTGKIRLIWYDSNSRDLRVGDKWRLTVRLKRPRGLTNPGGFDYERWLFARGVFARGYVRNHPPPQLLMEAGRYPIDRLRQRLAEDFHHLLPHNPYRGILTALAVGERRAIRNQQWDILTRTGTGHLLAISGLHIGLIAGLTFFLVRQLWGWFPALVLRFPAPKAGALAGVLSAGGYALLAGLSLPTQRALIMITVVMLVLLWQRSTSPSRILALALLLVLIWDPAAPLTGGFWLSFGAVATILYVMTARVGMVRPMYQWITMQLAISLAMLPATLIMFQAIPLLSPLANLIAIPWASVTVVPLTLLAVLVGRVSEMLQIGVLRLAVVTVDWLWQFLAQIGQLSWAVLSHPAPPVWTLAFVLPGLLLMIAPQGMAMRWAGAVLCLPTLFCIRPGPAPGDVWFTVLEVGQGLAAVVRTANHTLVYDTGPRLGSRFDAGSAALVPFLRHQGVAQIDTLIVSHPDKQHTGGVRSVLERFGAQRILTGSPEEVPVRGVVSCRRGMAWSWDHVRFSILHPPVGSNLVGNDASCVLLVESRGGRILLPGDIEPPAEASLVQAYGMSLKADVLVAPHHGAKGLSLPEFLDAVQARYVLFSTGYRNRFGFPRRKTTLLYGKSGAIVLDTARHGAITFRLKEGAVEPVPEIYRQTARRYWTTP